MRIPGRGTKWQSRINLRAVFINRKRWKQGNSAEQEKHCEGVQYKERPDSVEYGIHWLQGLDEIVTSDFSTDGGSSPKCFLLKQNIAVVIKIWYLKRIRYR
jgi:hypothetical protein